MLVSERIGQLFLSSGDRLEFTEYGGGERWAVLLHAELMTRRMHQPLARRLASEGFHVLPLDLLGHGRSDRPSDPLAYSVTAYAEQVEALLDEVGAEQALLVGVSLGANVALETAVRSPDRVRGLLLESPVLDNGFAAGLLRMAPLMLGARVAPLAFSGVRRMVRAVPRGVMPFWVGVALDTCNQRPGALAAMVHGVLFGRMAPNAGERRGIGVPVLLVGHRADPAHPWADVEMLAAELPQATVVRSRGPLEWRLDPARLDGAAISFALDCWDARSTRKRQRRSST
ncbi:alpha/beta fold hydrolase [Nocardioides campestrisoli]|uniref:alpha/beta fold hydrolase n=1 Tax=Nocardioides campestrisoli TaxID=2736757 RepID=UPI0015E725FD|nr:alpha/beta fold hydrolase [Nocardioides campestrisoli]